MKMIRFIEIGTKATKEDIEIDLDEYELIHIPVDRKSTMTNVYDLLVEEVTGDEHAMIALEKFIAYQEEDSFEQNIFESNEIILDVNDDNQYYMIFYIFEIKNILEDSEEKES